MASKMAAPMLFHISAKWRHYNGTGNKFLAHARAQKEKAEVYLVLHYLQAKEQEKV